ncbi:Uu.00g022790.m01.CDS01 [Anthostomella pinea]|uniref:Ubiquitin carboxyl-terminal hydrolase n=1 Tax=Anthostomella pinea TaxID=933095 RepID=A0AAI8W0V2_9PEZI|nr:Uu.00g022790.m01.CDS01 [Anthostomella pinea]
MSLSSTTTPDPPRSAPAFIPLEANPPVLTDLAHKLGLSQALQMHDVWSTEPELIATMQIPRPALALLVVFPLTAPYESERLAEDAGAEEYSGVGDDEPVLWWKQTIRNACGMMGLLHAVANGSAREYIEPNSTFDKLIKTSLPLPPHARSALLEQTPELACAHQEAASGTSNSTTAPDAQDDVDLHYVCFVKTEKDGGTLWALDGRRKGPVALGKLDAGEDVLSDKALLLGPVKILQHAGNDLRASCVALAGAN